MRLIIISSKHFTNSIGEDTDSQEPFIRIILLRRRRLGELQSHPQSIDFFTATETHPLFEQVEERIHTVDLVVVESKRRQGRDAEDDVAEEMTDESSPGGRLN